MKYPGLNPALISSFSVLGRELDDSSAPAECENIEAYAFMQKCLPNYGQSNKTAVEYLAEVFRSSDKSNITHSIQAKLLERFPNKRIVALATFIPELSAGEDRSEERENAIDAIKLLIDIVRNLQKPEFGSHPIQTIELVAGTRINGLMHSTSQPLEYTARRLSSRKSLSILLANLKSIAAYAIQTPTVYLALELEPGPLYVLAGSRDLQQLCKLIDNSDNPALKRCVGLNLDIPHWQFLAGISPEWLSEEANTNIRERIVHAHVSDHHKGHFGDTSIGTFNKPSQFENWYLLLSAISQSKRSEDSPAFSGFVSCELEACKDAATLKKGFLRLVESLTA